MVYYMGVDIDMRTDRILSSEHPPIPRGRTERSIDNGLEIESTALKGEGYTV